jgi:hypothetical protein
MRLSSLDSIPSSVVVVRRPATSGPLPPCEPPKPEPVVCRAISVAVHAFSGERGPKRKNPAVGEASVVGSPTRGVWISRQDPVPCRWLRRHGLRGYPHRRSG